MFVLCAFLFFVYFTRRVYILCFYTAQIDLRTLISCLLQRVEQRKFNPRQKFKWAILVVRSMIRLQRLRFTPEPLSVAVAQTDPYRIKILRKVSFIPRFFFYSFSSDYIVDTILSLQVIDGCAFRVYGHWVKKGEGQNRAALFENIPKTELKHLYVTNLSR